MSGDGEGKERIFFRGSRADIVDDHITLAILAALVRDDDDMRQASGDILRHQIAGLEILSPQFGAAPREKDAQVENTAMVDIGVGRFQSPDFRIG